MNSRISLNALLVTVAAACLAASGMVMAAGSGGNTGMTRTVDGYTLDLKLLPAEHFVSRSRADKPANAGAMVNAGGAKPMQKGSARHPNHHLVVFISRHGKPVEHAHVTMSYRMKGSPKSRMTVVPVNRMWVAGSGPKTTHYGNNVHLDPGMYRVHVTVNGKAQANFYLTTK